MKRRCIFLISILLILFPGAAFCLLSPGEESILSIQFSEDRVCLRTGGEQWEVNARSIPESIGTVQVLPVDGGLLLQCGSLRILWDEGHTIPSVPATLLCIREPIMADELSQIAPDYAVVCGNAAKDEATLLLLDARCRQVFRPDLQGTITARWDGAQLHFQTRKTISSSELFPHREAFSGTSHFAAREFDYDYVLNQNSHVFHLPGCPGAEQMKPENRLFSTLPFDTLVKAGYRPCSICLP